ncbi:MAG: LysR family transcriptional regulator [Burkholderiaceae bacterium]|nr:LysR family transcriptional regulator [Burkholderiaceae bacterium]
MDTATHRLLAALRMRQLELIATLTDTGSVRAAAQRLHLSAAAVSKGLRETESLFGAELFQRLPRGLSPTAMGEMVTARARLLLNEVAQLADELAARQGGRADEVRVGAVPFLTWTLLPRILQEMQRVPGGELPRARVVEGRLGDMCRQLEAGDIDVLVTMNMPSELGGLRSDGFVIEPIYDEQWTVVCSPHHPAARGSRVRRWADLVAEHWILPPRPTNARMMVEQVLLRRSLAPIVPWIESMNAITNLQLAAHGAGLTLAARCTLDAYLARGALVELPMEDLPPPVPIALVYRTGAARRPVLSALRSAAQRASSEAASASAATIRAASEFSPRKSRAQTDSSSVTQDASTGVGTRATRPRVSRKAMPKGTSSST